MAKYAANIFPNVQSQGQLLPIDALKRVLDRDKAMPGMTDADYHLAGEKLGEAINHSWQKLCSIWRNFSETRSHLADSEHGIALTRERLLLPLFQELGYGRLSPARAEERQLTLIDGTSASYPISHFRDETPIHLVGCNVSLDKKSPGIARQSPHALVQEFLNRKNARLWGILSNGLLLRILRDNASFSRQAFVEFNLEGIFNSGSFSEFALLWLCVHHSRIHSDTKEDCWLEVWSSEAQNASVAALDTLRENVSGAIQLLGNALLAKNPVLVRKLKHGELDRRDYFRQLLRLAYRLIFILVVEERQLLLAPDAMAHTRESYYNYWSLCHLRQLSSQTRGTKHHDLWEGLKIIMRALAEPQGCEPLGIRPMGGFLWSQEAMPDLENLHVANQDFLEVLRKLAFTEFDNQRRPIDFRNLGAQELGSIYESLLELQPDLTDGIFTLKSAPGNERKTSGSYYTPSQLIDSLLESALDPVINEAVKAENPEAALLNLKICDPACGSGHFLLACANRIARRLAWLRSGEMEPSPESVHNALRDVTGRCIYGMDINPMSVELCKLGIWLETHEPGKPLSFLDHHIVCANSLMGTTAETIRGGIPSDAYAPLGGDDKKAASELKKANSRQFAKMVRPQFEQFEAEIEKLLEAVQPPLPDAAQVDNLEQMRKLEEAWQKWQDSDEWQKKKFLYDLWTAAFVLPRYFPETGERLPDGAPVLSDQPFGVVWQTLLKFVNGSKLSEELVRKVEETAKACKFFHCEVMFPEVAAKGGFDAILGNPPWERIKLQEKEWFAAHNCHEIAEAQNAAKRRKLIAALEEEDPFLYGKWREAQRQSEVFGHFLRKSGLYPLCGRGDVNLYAVFAEWMRKSLNPSGRFGCIVPSGIASDDNNQYFFRDMIESRSLVSLYDFENRKKLFPDIDSRIKFTLLTSGSGARSATVAAQFVFFAHKTAELKEADRRFSLGMDEISLFNPNTRTSPIFRRTKDFLLARAVYRRHPVMIREKSGEKPEDNPWGISFYRMFDMANDAHLFKSREELEDTGYRLKGNVFEKSGEKFLPLYEAKMMQIYNHRASDIIRSKTAVARQSQPRELSAMELEDTERLALPMYWVAQTEVEKQLRLTGWKKGWLLGVRLICSATNEHTIISSIIPKNATGNSLALFFSNHPNFKFFPSMFSSIINDYFSRSKVGGINLSFFAVKQFPVLVPELFDKPLPWEPGKSIAEWLKPRIIELTYTAEDMRPFAEEFGYSGKPFSWDAERRAQIRAELDAAFFHFYLPASAAGGWQRHENESGEEFAKLQESFPAPRNALDYVMESFEITKRKDLKNFGEYRTKRLILENYDRFMEKISG